MKKFCAGTSRDAFTEFLFFVFELFLLRRFAVLRQNQVCHYRHDEYDRNAVFRKYGVDDWREHAEDFRNLGETDSDSQRQCRNGDVPLFETACRNHFHSAYDDAAEHHDGAAAQYRIRKGRQHSPEERKYSCQDHDAGADSDDHSIHDFGHGNQSHVLAEGSDRKASQDTGQHAGISVTGDRAFGFLYRYRPVQSGDCKRGGIADGLRGGYQENQCHGHDGTGFEHRLERHDGRKAYRCGVMQCGEIHRPHEYSEDITHDQSEKYGQLFPVGFRQHIEEQAAQQCCRSQNPVLSRTEPLVSAAAAEGRGTDRQQRKSDGRYDAGRNNRRDEFGPVFREETDGPLDKAADDYRADDGVIAILGADGAGYGHERKADAHYNRQSRAHLPYRKQLNQRTDSGNHHGGLNQLSRFTGPQVAGVCHDDQRCDIRDEHRQDVLQSEGNRFSQRNSSVQVVNIGNISF